jgi:tRNA threonylcarbamoyladenosine biosynthesis protein TsaB
MTSVLAVETSGTACSVCLDLDGSCFVETRHVERRHNELLLPMIDSLLAEAGIPRERIDVLAFGCGPGSFTGVRIAAAALQGIALARDLPVVPVPSSLALAEASRRADASSPATIWTSIRSRADLFYLAAYLLQDEQLSRVHADRLCAAMSELPYELSERTTTIRLAGERPSWWQSPSALPAFRPLEVTAEEIAALARVALAEGRAVDAALALPLYVSGDTPWTPSHRGTA